MTVFISSHPGRGGYGSALERSLEAVVDDLYSGLVSSEQARQVHGVVLSDKAQVD
ncbi:MAG: hypothetical protein K0U61_13285 [Alphaproteobacteria bacterium]|nr:hypothetical protein [Alphaproteobacteria bacterium]